MPCQADDMVWSATAAEQALAVDRLRRARSLLFWRYLVERASAAAEAQAVGLPFGNLLLYGSSRRNAIVACPFGFNLIALCRWCAKTRRACPPRLGVIAPCPADVRKLVAPAHLAWASSHHAFWCAEPGLATKRAAQQALAADGASHRARSGLF